MAAFWQGRRRLVLGVSFGAVVVGAVGAYIALGAQGAAPAVEAVPPLEFQALQVVRPEPHRMAFDLTVPGTVQAVSQATVRSKLSAVIRQVNVREGDTVHAGQVLVEFDTASLRALLAEREAGVALARANLEQAQRTREANAQLVQRNFITQNAFDSADAAYQTQAASLAAAQAQLAQTQLQLDDAIVRSPIDGQVARRFVQSGEKVAADAQLLALVDLAQLEVQAQAAAADVAHLRPGAAAQVLVEGLSGQAFGARVERINPSAEPGSRAIDLYVSFPNERGVVRAGMFASVRLHLVSDLPALTLPLPAVQAEAGQSVVWAIRDGHLARHIVTLGRRDEKAQLVEILGGVEPAEQVLASRFDNLKEGGEARVSGALAAPTHGATELSVAGRRA